MSQQKRKHVMVTIQQKLEILQKLENGATVKQIRSEYNLGSSTVRDIKKKRDKLLEFSSSMATSRIGINQRQTMRESPFAILNKAVLQWFNHERTLGHPISGNMIVQRAKELFVTLGLGGTFDGSYAWLSRFKDRNGIRYVGGSLDCVWARMDISNQQELDSEMSNAREVIESECFHDKEDADDSFVLSERSANYEMSLENKTVALENQNLEDSTLESNDVINDTYTTNIRTAEEDESLDDSCICHNLKSIVKKLQSVSDKLAADLLCDSYDEFTKYISSLLRGLPKKKALNLKKKLVNDIIEELLAQDRGDQELPETTPKKGTSKQLFRKNLRNVYNTRQATSNVSRNSKESSGLESVPIVISNQSSSLSSLKRPQYNSVNIPPGTDLSVVHNPASITECESIRTVTSTADGTLLAITLPSRGSLVGLDASRSPPPLISASPRTRSQKRKHDSSEPVSKRNTTVTQFPLANDSISMRNEANSEFPSLVAKVTLCPDTSHSIALINEASECDSPIKQDRTDAECNLEDCTDVSEININEELMDEKLSMIMIKQEVDLEEDIEDVAQLFLCDTCLTHCPTKEELIQHFQQDHPGRVPTFKEDNL